MLGSGNLGLVYLMDERRRLTLEEIDARHPKLIPALRAHPTHRLAARALRDHGARRARARAAPSTSKRTTASRERIRSTPFSSTAPRPSARARRLRARGRHHRRQLLRRGPRRGLRVRGADLVPRRPRWPADETVRALSGGTRTAAPSRSSAPRRLHGVLAGWRAELNDGRVEITETPPAPPAEAPAPRPRAQAPRRGG